MKGMFPWLIAVLAVAVALVVPPARPIVGPLVAPLCVDHGFQRVPRP